MTRHHPTDESLLRYAAGTLAAGPLVAVAAHLEACPQCRDAVRRFQALGGALLTDLPPEPLAPDALARALARIEVTPMQADRSPRRAPQRPPLPAGLTLPRALDDLDAGPWRWAGPGVHISHLIDADRTTIAQLLRIGPGRRLPEHGHTGREYTHVLSGAFSDASGRYLPGDLCEVDFDTEHQPVVDSPDDCICLVAIEGRMRFSGPLGRLIQPFVRL